jgi:hypothetical protein
MDEAAQQHNELTAETGRRGGQKRMAQLNDQERSTLGKHAAWARWHPREFQAAKEKAERQAYLLQQALKDKQLPLV